MFKLELHISRPRIHPSVKHLILTTLHTHTTHTRTRTGECKGKKKAEQVTSFQKFTHAKHTDRQKRKRERQAHSRMHTDKKISTHR